MKIVINAVSARRGGGQTYLQNLLAHLPRDLNVEVLVYAPVSLELPEDRRISRGVASRLHANPMLRTVWEAVALPRILARERARVLFCPGGIVATRVPGDCKTVTMFRNMIPFDPRTMARVPVGLQKLRNVLLRKVMLRSMESADLTIFVSEYARTVIEPICRPRKSITIPHGIHESFLTHSKELLRPTWLPSTEYLLYVSRFDVYKHQFEVALAFADLPSDLVERYTLLLVGELDKKLVSRVKALARERRLEDRILIVGSISHVDLPVAYHHAVVNLFASSCENCPNILLESLGAGRPVLSSNVMPMPEFGANAVEYFSPFDSESIGGALERVLRDDTRRADLAAAAARRSADFNWAEAATATWRRISELAST